MIIIASSVSVHRQTALAVAIASTTAAKSSSPAAAPAVSSQQSRVPHQGEEEATAMASAPSGPPQPPAILRLKNRDDIELPVVLGSGTRATVMAGLVDGEWTAFKIAAPQEGSQQPIRPTTAVRVPRRGGHQNPPCAKTYVSLSDLLRKEGHNLAAISAAHPPTQPADQKAMGIIDKLLTTVRALPEGVRGHRRALDDYDTVLLDHCVNNIYLRRTAMGGGVSDLPGVLFIDHGNTLHARQPGPLLCRSDGTIPPPLYPQKAALAPLSPATVEQEQQLPVNTQFCGSPEQSLHWYRRNHLADEWIRWHTTLPKRSLEGVATMEHNNPAAEAIWMGERTVVFNYAVTIHNVLRSERWQQSLERLEAWADKSYIKADDGATEHKKQ
ncbi:unnamed protein product [Vitrella brassicaformis CCMP3155]|uniref:Uncharacterized protein n=1 Tax=Vitrella brassicaformis (strain CCMP3155) TaxID=1169540 RepID=A0A0G4G6B2_VITBC|nr:unnamed protein product [Vitrella brassicaformis CCMP3155]|eukprot:CEM24066.1 unnamed protein product [Vitrella brassicaformis CCMP3155]